MYSERSGQRPSTIADDVNRDISWAVDLAKKSSTIKVQTLHYRQDPLYNNQNISGWKARQSIRLESTEAESLSALIGDLQSRLSVASLRYTVSPTRRDEVERRLIGYRIVNMDIITSGHSPAPIRMRAAVMMEDAAVSAPSIEAGVQTVSVQVSGTIELKIPQ